MSGVLDTTAPAPAPGAAGAAPWSGKWVADHLELELRTTATPLGLDLADLLGLAVRRNPRRAHLLVSRVLGKHVPTDPRVIYGAGVALGELVRCSLSGSDDVPPGLGPLLHAALSGDRAAVADLATTTAAVTAAATAAASTGAAGRPVVAVVLGYAETATGLGQCVADALGSVPYLHSTRRSVPGVEAVSAFEEEHSHATTHLLLPADPGFLREPGPMVLVDDELSTGRTALNTITALQRLAPRERYVIAALVDLRSDEDRTRLEERAAALRTRIDVVALASGHVRLPPDAIERSERLVAANPPASPPPVVRTASDGRASAARRIDVGWPTGLPESGRHGVGPADRQRLDAYLPSLADRLAESLAASFTMPWQDGSRSSPPHVLVLGSEELMYVPLRLAAALADIFDRGPSGMQVRCSSTTRSPIVTVDDPGYAIRSSLTFPANDDSAEQPAPRFAYNVAADDQGEGFVAIVLVVDEVADTPSLNARGGLLDQLSRITRDLVLVVLPDEAARAARTRSAREAT